MYTGVKVVTSTVKSDHLAIIAYTGSQPKDINKKRTVREYRPRTPDHHAAFLDFFLTLTGIMLLMQQILKLLSINFTIVFCLC